MNNTTNTAQNDAIALLKAALAACEAADLLVCAADDDSVFLLSDCISMATIDDSVAIVLNLDGSYNSDEVEYSEDEA